LGTIGESELSVLDSRYDIIEKGVRLFLENDPAKAMSILNRLK
jgi:hypothetical protein